MRTAYRIAAAAAVVFLAAGCDGRTYTPPEPRPSPPPPAENRFDPTAVGTVRGRVRWAGDVPDVPPIAVPTFTLTGVPAGAVPNPNRPDVDPATKGVRSAVVFLRGVDPAAAKPWDLPSAAVEIDDHAIRVHQGTATGRVGFVRAGAAVQVRSAAANFAGVRGRGADFFTFMFPPSGVPVVRTVAHPGRVELTAASGQFWAAADLFVGDHPYYAQPAPDGRFVFADVPAGAYELVVWHPNFYPGPVERDPETGAPSRRKYGDPAETVVRMRVAAGMATETVVELTGADFRP